MDQCNLSLNIKIFNDGYVNSRLLSKQIFLSTAAKKNIDLKRFLLLSEVYITALPPSAGKFLILQQ